MLYRWLVVICGTLLPLMGMLNPPPDAVDPIWMRLVISGLLFSIFGLSFVSAFVKKHIFRLFITVGYLALVWMAGLVWSNHLSAQYVTAYLILFVIGSLVIERNRELLVYSGFAIGLAVAVAIFTVDPVFVPKAFVTLLAALVIITFSLRGYQIIEKDVLEQSKDNVKMVKETAFDNGFYGVLVVDTKGFIIDYNQYFQDLWKMPTEAIEHSDPEFSTATAQAMVKDPDQLFHWIQYGRDHPLEETSDLLEFKDGRFVQRYSKPLRMGEKVKGRLWFFNEVTEQKQRETLLEQRNFELDSFVYRASHDLKAPLNSIMGLIQLVEMEKDVDEIRNLVKLMDRSTGKLDEFIRELVHFSQDARLEVNAEPLVFDPFVAEIQDSLAHMDGADSLTVNLDIDQDQPFNSDLVRLKIIFGNLYSNAIKYRDQRKEQQELNIRIQSNGKAATIEFEDNGVGIPEPHQKRIFELFFRASHQAPGSGMGLYNTLNAVERLNGQIQCISTEGKGTTFRVEIPNATIAAA